MNHEPRVFLGFLEEGEQKQGIEPVPPTYQPGKNFNL